MKIIYAVMPNKLPDENIANISALINTIFMQEDITAVFATTQIATPDDTDKTVDPEKKTLLSMVSRSDELWQFGADNEFRLELRAADYCGIRIRKFDINGQSLDHKKTLANEIKITKAELRTRMKSGELLGDIFPLTNGQECLIFKAKKFVPGDKILYIPDVHLNKIPYLRSMCREEIVDAISCCYTGNNFIDECEGNIEMAERLFYYCDWQHPSSAYSEVCDDEEIF